MNNGKSAPFCTILHYGVVSMRDSCNRMQPNATKLDLSNQCDAISVETDERRLVPEPNSVALEMRETLMRQNPTCLTNGQE